MTKVYEDYPETIELDITQELIDKAYADRTQAGFAILRDCVASQCARPLFPEAQSIISAGEYVSIDYTAYYCHEELRKVIKAFDLHEAITPVKLLLTKRPKRDDD